jgi:hypothetical protein
MVILWTRQILEASSDSATTCAWQMGNLTFQAYSANVFKPSKGWKLWLQASSVWYILRACDEHRPTWVLNRFVDQEVVYLLVVSVVSRNRPLWTPSSPASAPAASGSSVGEAESVVAIERTSPRQTIHVSTMLKRSQRSVQSLKAW